MEYYISNSIVSKSQEEMEPLDIQTFQIWKGKHFIKK